MSDPIAQEMREAGRLYHSFGANVTAIAKGSKGPKYKWKHWHAQRQTERDVDRLMWNGWEHIPTAAGVGIIAGINGFRVFDPDKCQSPTATLDRILVALGLPLDYQWVENTGSGKGGHVHFICHDDMPAGALPSKKEEQGVFTGLSKDDTFHHLELRWQVCQTVVAPSVHMDTGNRYEWRHGTPTTPPAEVSIGQVINAFYSLAVRSEEPAKTEKAARTNKIQDSNNTDDDDTKHQIRQRFDLVKYATDKFGGETQKESNGEIRILGHGGLMILPDDEVWYTFQDEVGGDCFDLAGKHLYDGRWDRKDPRMFVDALKEAANYTGVTLPEPKPTDPAHGLKIGARKAVLEAEQQANPLVRKLTHVSELHKFTPAEEIITGVISRNKLSLIYGMPGAGKSLINIDIGLTVSQYATVVYLAGEDIEEYKARIDAWCEQHHAQPGNLYFWPEPVNLLNPDSVAQFLIEVAEVKPTVIIIDTLATCMTGADENSTKEMGIAIEALHYIRRQTEAGILVCHHTGWSDTHERGSSALRGAVRTAIKVAQNDDGLISVTCEKSNNAAKFEPRYFRLVPKGESVTVIPSSKLTGRGTPLTQKHYDILEALNLSIFSDGASFTQIVEHTSLPKSTVNRALSKLLEHSFVECGGGRNKVYSLTTSGSADLQRFLFQSAGASSTQVPSEFHGTAEQVWNWTVALPERLEPSSHEVPPSSNEVPPSSNEVPHPEPNHSEFRSSPPPYKGGTWNTDSAEQSKEPPQTPSERDQDLAAEVQAAIDAGDIPKAKEVLHRISDRALWNTMFDKIDDAKQVTP